MLHPLTSTQQAVLQFVADHIARCGFPPTYAEIADNFRWKSANAATTHINAMRVKGVIETTKETARSLRITTRGHDILGTLGAPSALPMAARVLQLPVYTSATLPRGVAA